MSNIPTVGAVLGSVMDTITGYRKVLAREDWSQEENQATSKIRTNNEKSESCFAHSDQQRCRGNPSPVPMLETRRAS